MDRDFMLDYYRRMYENPCDLVVLESNDYIEKRNIRYKIEDELTEMLGGTNTLVYKKFDEFISASAEENYVMLEETYLLGAADREKMLK